MLKNYIDFKDCLKRGKSAHQLFDEMAKARGYKVIRSTAHQDMVEHWDSMISKEISIKVDVKALKVIFARELQDECMWIELANVKGKLGWLYGRADKIAFQTFDGFVLFDRMDLVLLIRKYLRYNVFHRFNRKGRQDDLILVPLCLLKAALPFEIWENVI